MSWQHQSFWKILSEKIRLEQNSLLKVSLNNTNSHLKGFAMIIKHKFLFLLFAPLFAVFLAMTNVYYKIQIWKYEGEDIAFQIGPGDGFSKINGRLFEKKIINSAKLFHHYAKINGLMTKFKAGNYIIKTNSNMIDVLNTLVSGKSITISVTIPEGKNLFEIAEILASKKIIPDENSFIAVAKNPATAEELSIHGNRVEGYLFPETYHFSEGTSPEQVIKAMVSTFNKKTESLDFENSGLTKHQVIILASVVEKETGAKWERPLIAGVFRNRLSKRMRLESDPTTIYGIWENYTGNLTRNHLREKTAYNTYKIPGLPAGPISNPGLESIKAVINPEKHNFLFFVSKNDGTHIFSENYKKHQNAVNGFQKTQSARAGKSWRDLSQ